MLLAAAALNTLSPRVGIRPAAQLPGVYGVGPGGFVRPPIVPSPVSIVRAPTAPTIGPRTADGGPAPAPPTTKIPVSIGINRTITGGVTPCPQFMLTPCPPGQSRSNSGPPCYTPTGPCMTAQPHNTILTPGGGGGGAVPPSITLGQLGPAPVDQPGIIPVAGFSITQGWLVIAAIVAIGVWVASK